MAYFVSIEGIEGAGKSTVRTKLSDFAVSLGVEVVLTREPGATTLGQTIRGLVLDPKTKKIDPIAELMLFAADRAQHLEEVVRPALKRGALVICDRFTHSTVAYQGYGRGLELKNLNILNEIVTRGLKPDLVLLLDLDPKIGLARAEDRARRSSGSFQVEQIKEAVATGSSETSGWNKFEELDLDFHHRIRNGFLELSKDATNNFKVIDASKTPDEVAGAAVTELKQLLSRDKKA